MANVIIKSNSSPALKSNQRVDTDYASLDGMAIRNVVQESWRSKIKQDKQLTEMIGEHANNMRALLGNFEYETFCVHNLIANTKSIGRFELKAYTKTVEAIAYFYRKKIGTELTSALLTGITSRAKSLDSLNRYYELMTNELSERLNCLQSRTKIENRDLEHLVLELRYNEASILRFFRKRRMNEMKSRINLKRVRLNRFANRISRNRRMLDYVSGLAKGGK